LIAAVVGSVQAQAQNATPAWPQRAVRIIVGFQPGSATDITARLFGERLSARWGKPVVIDNRP
jgi:tripartite-type tricarboxylate transporter receptor subunit TctC